jgi:hypothetical protein
VKQFVWMTAYPAIVQDGVYDFKRNQTALHTIPSAQDPIGPFSPVGQPLFRPGDQASVIG